ncbi:ubiquitin-activating enzyme E1 3 [Didymella exigua CBS 183.55]|uniref:Ubiquitin-activating enzyme E1-like n=1 Tax=Didymella exigua CBS 183.55 TaxID=1150837 RepID=A0A6A5RUU9_9PLEO|nr:ubiquitin-activating enzyme E1 3 [Didymella exigua CBS 183.55]KAF1930934.1 ubiquitin-activating enzyme E1 3 [Didymella exigua CBS 183.55]
MSRDKFAQQSLGGTLHGMVKKSRVLMVGAGGIGCELLKNLVLTGFGEIHIVDLDTIDLSNLNRQFLFRNEHIKKSKALVAKEAAQKFNPNVKIEAYHENIKDSQFNAAWFQQFNLVFNALDNLDARRHVNKMCLASNVPLIESGTTGFNGNVQVIKKGDTECYDCVPKPTPKTFATCTIRSTPSQLIHCIVWGKSYLFAELFGISEDDAPELDQSLDKEGNNADEIAKLRQEATKLKRVREQMGSQNFPRAVFEMVFREDIERLLSMEDMWKGKRAPVALDFDQLSEESTVPAATLLQDDQRTWSTEENFAIFVDSILRLGQRLETERAQKEVGKSAVVLSFDKDDADTLDFVVASANLRAAIFGIEPRSKFDIKQMAGNIIPAIATTNAMTAGLCVLQAFKILRYTDPEQLKRHAQVVFLTRTTERNLAADLVQPPNPECPTCSVTQITLTVDTARAKLSDLVEDVLKSQLDYGEEFNVTKDGDLLYDADEDAHLDKTFSELGLITGSSVTVIDDADEDCKVNVQFSIDAKNLPSADKPISMLRDLKIATRPKAAIPVAAPSTNGHGHANTNGTSNGTISGVKRTADEASLEDDIVRKKGKVIKEKQVMNADDILVIEDEKDDGVIELD